MTIIHFLMGSGALIATWIYILYQRNFLHKDDMVQLYMDIVRDILEDVFENHRFGPNQQDFNYMDYATGKWSVLTEACEYIYSDEYSYGVNINEYPPVFTPKLSLMLQKLQHLTDSGARVPTITIESHPDRPQTLGLRMSSGQRRLSWARYGVY